MSAPYRRYVPLEHRLEDASDAPETADDSVCRRCGQFYWFCQGHPKPAAPTENKA